MLPSALFVESDTRRATTACPHRRHSPASRRACDDSRRKAARRGRLPSPARPDEHVNRRRHARNCNGRETLTRFANRFTCTGQLPMLRLLLLLTTQAYTLLGGIAPTSGRNTDDTTPSSFLVIDSSPSHHRCEFSHRLREQEASVERACERTYGECQIPHGISLHYHQSELTGVMIFEACLAVAHLRLCAPARRIQSGVLSA